MWSEPGGPSVDRAGPGRREVAQAPQASRMVGRGQGLDSVLGEGWQESTGMLAVPLDACGQVLSPPGLPCPG